MKQNIFKLIIGLLLLSHSDLMAKTYTPKQVSASSKSAVKVLTKKNFKSVIETKNKLVVVKFYASWCRPCQKMKPEFSEASRMLQEKVIYASVNVDDLSNITKNMGVKSIPTTLVFKNGQEISRKLSVMNKEEISTWIHSFL